MSQTLATEADRLFAGARSVLAGGVSAALRLHPYVGRPVYLAGGEGAYVTDLDGQRYLDFNLANGAALLGHRHPGVEQAVIDCLRAGVPTAAETPSHERLAALLTEIIPAAERVRFATNGSDVTIVALRIARHATGRTAFVKFEGHYHGLLEPFLFRQADPTGADGAAIPSSGGVPVAEGEDVFVLPWNDAAAFEACLDRHGDRIAAVFCEPVHYNAGCIPPAPGFLELLRARTSAAGAVLVFDEVLSGFRMALGGAQAHYGVTPDLTTVAKALANGMPLAALAGRADLMESLAPTGPVAHSGTYSGHPLGVAAALAALEELRAPGLYDRLNATADAFYRDLQAILDRHALPVRVQGLGARFGLYFGRTAPVRSYNDARDHDHDLHKRFVLACLERGLYFHAYSRQGPPGHAGISLAHSATDLATALTAIDDVAAEMARPA
ncbi:MAG: Glutamate-1-semialdehyde 2,1-aminomutase [uncultured Thermomicrobiales bacterium]|uniref:Glutamate-1-semialdehyde 2,1-aminomutase n=1 Tax=uncultured Thermomicrobiales bacterium TaxID=1645740 RepID=A0A6J4VCV5_9BACT|nr:MAG: Glutamate-1-semialdehyde 2,1-aminomutase [uncultured Thermomicrobiales bacterium]